MLRREVYVTWMSCYKHTRCSHRLCYWPLGIVHTQSPLDQYDELCLQLVLGSVDAISWTWTQLITPTSIHLPWHQHSQHHFDFSTVNTTNSNTAYYHWHPFPLTPLIWTPKFSRIFYPSCIRSNKATTNPRIPEELSKDDQWSGSHVEASTGCCDGEQSNTHTVLTVEAVAEVIPLLGCCLPIDTNVATALLTKQTVKYILLLI